MLINMYLTGLTVNDIENINLWIQNKLNNVWFLSQSFSSHFSYFDTDKIRFQYIPKEKSGDGDENNWKCGKEDI